jgi:putative copper export protein
MMCGTGGACLVLLEPGAAVASGYGRLLLLKAFVLLPLALACAVWLRRKYLVAEGGDARLALIVEALAGAALLGLASLLSQSSPDGGDMTSFLRLLPVLFSTSA